MSYSVTSWQGHISMERLRCTLSTFHAEVNDSNMRILEFRTGDKHSTATRQRQRIARLPTSHISTHYRGACTLTRRAPSRMPRMPRMPQTRRTRALARKCDASPRSRITRAQIRLLCGFARSGVGARRRLKRALTAPERQLSVDSFVNQWLTSCMDPLTSIRHCMQAVSLAEHELEDAVSQARIAGHSWADIGQALNVSRQAAFKRFGAVRNPFLSLIHI